MPKKHIQSAKTRKRKGKDLDEVCEDLVPEKAAKLLNQEVDPDLPGEGQFYCIECSRHFVSAAVLADHRKTKAHKRRMKALKETPYSQAEADAAAGVGTYNRELLGSNTLRNKKKFHDSGIVIA